MRKIYLMIGALLLCFYSMQAQTPQYYNQNNSTGSNNIPLNFGTAYNRCQWIYLPGVFNSSGPTGIPAYAGDITTVYVRIITAGSAATAYSDFKLSLGQVSGTDTMFNNTTFVTGLTPVYYQNSFAFSGVTANAWYAITLQTPFTYDPALSLVFEINYSNNVSTGGHTVALDNVGGKRLFGPPTATAGAVSAGAVDFGMDLVPSPPCVTPPTAGIAQASKTTPCLGQNVSLILSGNSYGTGQTYQWESATLPSGPWVPEGSSSNTPYVSVTPVLGTNYYRCQVTCGASTVVSVPDTVTVPSLYPSGIYTINSALPTGAGNFQSFTDAVSAIACGIAGSVTFNVAPGSGPYLEQIDLPATIGANASKPVVFNGNGNVIRTNFLSAPASYTTINLDGADYISFDNLNIEALGTYGYGVHLMNSADHNTFSNCNINANSASTSINSMGVSMSASPNSYFAGGVNGSYNTFSSCNVTGGYAGFIFYGISAIPDSNNSIINCTVKDYTYYGCFYFYQRDATLSGNLIERPTKTSANSVYGIYLGAGSKNMLAEKNTIRNLFGGLPNSIYDGNGIYLGADGSLGFENKIYNNLIDIKTNGGAYGISLAGADSVNVYHNTITINDPNGSTGVVRGINSTGTLGGINIQNNNISIVKGGIDKKWALYYSNATARVSNYNNLYVNAPPNTGFTGYFSGDISSLTAWQAANSGAWDGLSTDLDPMFSNVPSNYNSGNAALDNTGLVLASVNTDITGASRSASAPDVGAYEYTVPICSGSPTIGIATINDTTLCVGGPVALSLSSYSSGQGITIQWEESLTANGPWAAVTGGGTSSTYQFTFATPMYYRASITCSNSSTTVSSNVVFAGAAPFYYCYCSPNTGVPIHNFGGQFINNVSILGTSLNNSNTTALLTGYTLYDTSVATQSADLLPGATYIFKVTDQYSGAYGADIWIDFDQSGTFDAGEYLPLGVATGINFVDSNYTIPTGQPTGMTGMRVRAYNGAASAYGASNACLLNVNGYETEDYVVNILPAPTCLAPTSVQVSNIQTNSVDVNWTSTSATQSQIEYGAIPYTQGTGTIVTTTMNPHGITGLMPGTSYALYVRDICGPGDTSAWTPSSFVTACTAVPLPWTENFDALASVGPIFPNCWVKENGDWQTSPASSYNTSLSPLNHLRNAWAANNEFMWTPEFSLTANVSYDFSFYVAGDGYTGWNVDLFQNAIPSSVNAAQIGTTYSPAGPGTLTIQPYVKQTYTFVPSSSGSYFFGIRVNQPSNAPWYIAFDDFRMEVTPSCLAPTTLTATNSTATSADLGWTSTATQFQIEYGQGNTFTPGTGTRVGPAGVTNPYTVGGLTPATMNSYFVRAICGSNDTSAWSSRQIFSTLYPVPPNDTCVDAIDISSGLVTSGYVINATQSAPPCDGTSVAGDVWYTFTTGPNGGSIMDTVNTTNTGADVVVQAYSGTCGSLVPMIPTAGTTFDVTNGCVDGPAAGKEWSNYNVAPNITYYIRVYSYGATPPGTFTIQVVGGPLAIKLGKISATNIGASNRVDWNTLSEETTDKFELQRSADGDNFTRIATVPAKGQAHRYTYMDNAPVAGYNYYRLIMREVSGQGTYSETVKAFVKTEGFTVEAFPNPVSQDLMVRVSGVQGGDAIVEVTDITGKVIKRIAMKGVEELIDMSGLANGIYLIKYSDTNHTKTIRVNKQ